MSDYQYSIEIACSQWRSVGQETGAIQIGREIFSSGGHFSGREGTFSRPGGTHDRGVSVGQETGAIQIGREIFKSGVPPDVTPLPVAQQLKT